MKQNANSRRSGEIAREKLASILLFEVADPDLDLVTLTGCEVSVDRSFVRAYVTCESERIARALENRPPTIDVVKDEFGYPVSEASEDAGEDDESTEAE